MEIREEETGTIIVLGPVGHLDTRTSTEFEEKINTHLSAPKSSFIIDFSELDYISSAGLRVLLMLAKKLKATDGVLILAAMNEHVREVFEVAGFTKIFEIEPDRAQALERLGAGGGEETAREGEVDSELARVSALASRLMSGDAFRPARTDEIPLEVIEIADKAAELLGIAAQTRKSRPRSAPAEPAPPPSPFAPSAPPPPSAAPVEEKDEQPGFFARLLRMLRLR